MPGTLAKQYQQLGGKVQLMGKPDPLIYAAAMELAAQAGFKQQQQQPPQQQWLVVGDSLEHDIAGWVRGFFHRNAALCLFCTVPYQDQGSLCTALMSSPTSVVDVSLLVAKHRVTHTLLALQRVSTFTYLVSCRGSAAGLQSLFIAGGIHASDVHLRGSPDQANTDCSWDKTELVRLCQEHAVLPTYCMPFLQP